MSVALAGGVVGLLYAAGLVRAFVPVAIALTTTALGTLLPILREQHLLGGRLGNHLLASGAVGELLPIIAVAVFLGATNRWVALISLLAVAAAAFGLTLLSRSFRMGRLREIIEEGEHETTQTTVRGTVLLLVLLLASPSSSTSTRCSGRSWPAWSCGDGRAAACPRWRGSWTRSATGSSSRSSSCTRA
jgi:Kef-type K+ transport system membrane component KefB